jgi:hypothetical protein
MTMDDVERILTNAGFDDPEVHQQTRDLAAISGMRPDVAAHAVASAANAFPLPPIRTVCLHGSGWWIFRRHCGRMVDLEGRCPVHGYHEDI